MVGLPSCCCGFWVYGSGRIGGFYLTWLFVRTFGVLGGFSSVSLPVQRSPLWPASWLPVLDKSRGSKSVEVQRVWGIHDDRLQFMAGDDALGLDEALEGGNVSRAWSFWSSAAEAALADDAYSLQVVGGSFVARTVRLGGPKVRKARRNFADPLGGEGAMCSCVMMLLPAVLLDLRRRF